MTKAVRPTPYIRRDTHKILCELEKQKKGHVRVGVLEMDEPAVAFHLSKLGYSLAEISGMLGYKSHSTAHSKIETYYEKMETAESERLNEETINEIKIQNNSSYKLEGILGMPRKDRLCLEAMAELGIPCPEQTLNRLRERENGKLPKSRALSKLRVNVALIVYGKHGSSLTTTDISTAVGYNDGSWLRHVLMKRNNGNQHNNSEKI